jgi:hypothetical protein
LAVTALMSSEPPSGTMDAVRAKLRQAILYIDRRSFGLRTKSAAFNGMQHLSTAQNEIAAWEHNRNVSHTKCITIMTVGRMYSDAAKNPSDWLRVGVRRSRHVRPSP